MFLKRCFVMMQTCVPEPNTITSKLGDLGQVAWSFTSSSSMFLRAKQSQCSWRVNLPLQVTSFPEHEYCRSWCRGCLAGNYSFSHLSPECSPGPESGSTWREEGRAKGGVWTLRKSVLTCILLKHVRMS